MRITTPLRHRIISSTLSLLWRCSAATQRSTDRSQTLRPLLRRFPFWTAGHRLLAEESLLHDNVGCAYASALCMSALEPHDQSTAFHVNFILGRCYLRRGDWNTAHHYLQEARLVDPANAAAQEEDAAALLLGGEFREALTILEAIPERALSSEGKAARAFVRSKVAGS